MSSLPKLQIAENQRQGRLPVQSFFFYQYRKSTLQKKRRTLFRHNKTKQSHKFKSSDR